MAGLSPSSFAHCRCEVVLGEFLKETKKNPSSVKFAEMANILVIHCQTTGEHVAGLQTPSSSEAPLPVLGRVLLGVGGGVTAGPGAMGPCGRDSASVSMEAFSPGLGPRWGKIWRPPCWQAWHQHHELKGLEAGVM